jgi:hypothetical protein
MGPVKHHSTLPRSFKSVALSPLKTEFLLKSPTFLDKTRATLKTTRPTILLLLRVYSLPR